MTKKQDRFSIIQLCSGSVGSGKDFWAYIKMPLENYKRYVQETSLKGHAVILEEYGEVLHKGWGVMPDAESQNFMKEKYNVDHNAFSSTKKEIIEQFEGNQ